MPHVKFTADYNHRWPSRAISSFKEGWFGAVKREVAEAAIAKGSATIIDPPARHSADAKKTGPVGRASDGPDAAPGAGGDRGGTGGDAVASDHPATGDPADVA